MGECTYEVSGDATAAGPGPHLENRLLPSPQKDRQLEETQDISAGEKKKKNLKSICILELKANLQKQIFLSEQICLAFTPRNRPRTGSPWQALAATQAQISRIPKL